MLENKKHIFWQALIITITIFIFGMVIGIYFEQIRTDNVNTLFYNSESELFDTISFLSITDLFNVSCDELVKLNIAFADKVYTQALEVDKIDTSNQATDSLKAIHRKYDVLRTILWINILNLKKQCPNVNDIVYLYIYHTEDHQVKSQEIVMSRLLSDLKQKRGNDFILIPIATNSDINSLDYILNQYNITDIPTIFINEKYKITNPQSITEIEKYLN